MRSCKSAAHCCFCASVSAPSIHTAIPRSMRSMLSKPQFRAMSVAFEAHGEMVPMRGAIKNKCRPADACGVCPTLSAASKACNFSILSASGASALPAKYQYSLFSPAGGRPAAAAFCNNFSTRKSDKAVAPRKGKTTDINSAHSAVGKKCDCTPNPPFLLGYFMQKVCFRRPLCLAATRLKSPYASRLCKADVYVNFTSSATDKPNTRRPYEKNRSHHQTFQAR